VDPNVFPPRRATRPGPLTFLLGGSQDQWYRLEAAVRAVAELVRRGHDARLIVTGRLRWAHNATAAHEQAAGLVRSVQLVDRVEFTGPYPQQAAPAIFQRADILLHTKYNDPCPAVVVEALATGLPVVFSSSGGVPELVADAGVGVPAPLNWDVDVPPEPVALADAAERVLGDLSEFSERARARATSRLDIAQWLARHRAVFAGQQ
jgi:glycosyltransferase involved in cell wall biosynthesis